MVEDVRFVHVMPSLGHQVGEESLVEDRGLRTPRLTDNAAEEWCLFPNLVGSGTSYSCIFHMYATDSANILLSPAPL